MKFVRRLMSGLLTGAAVLGLSSSVVHAGRDGQGGGEIGDNTGKSYNLKKGPSASYKAAWDRNTKSGYLDGFDWRHSQAADLFSNESFTRPQLESVIRKTCEMVNDKSKLSLKGKMDVLRYKECCYKFIDDNIDIFSAYRHCFDLSDDGVLIVTK